VNFYKLDGHTPVPVRNQVQWGAWMWAAGTDRHVAEDHIGDVYVSTVFLGFDHGMGLDGPPILFETMIFGGDYDQYQERYATWEQAEAGHQGAVRLVEGRPEGADDEAEGERDLPVQGA